MDRLDELREEERSILERIQENQQDIRTGSMSKDIFEADDGTSVEEPTIKKSRVELARVENSESETDKEFDGDIESESSSGEEEFCDDGKEVFYSNRITKWISSLEEDELVQNINVMEQPLELQYDDLIFPHLVDTDVDGCKVPEIIWNRLLDYQREGVAWLLDLYRQEVGGILGDEMGLGKTIQIISLLSSLQVSGKLDRPVLIICPATVMKQWVKELHAWWPPLRVVILHSAVGSLGDRLEDALRLVCKKGHVLVTSYGHLQQRGIGRKILNEEFSVAVLDEGHKIRNPLTDISILCKQIRTPHRIILSGTPIQNNLVELWSLMDFCYPGRLGSLNVFKKEIAQPIHAGGYLNASSLQIQTSYRCACILKDLIAPYLLRRVKADVAQSLPTKQEQVLFCQLTPYQRELYGHYVNSEDVRAILAGEKNILAGIDVLRKICNHPALLRPEDEELYGLSHIEVPKEPAERSGKLAVLASILEHWHRGGHRALLFCQTRQMLDIVEAFIAPKYEYQRMDGTTPIHNRMALVDNFNNNTKCFIFLLTTRVGGLGVNLTGANRVLIYDPDWNPSTDMQARERAWRLGQTRPVTIYRMLTVGTIEEKIYHRQIFKQYLTNRILADPKQTRFFKSSDLNDLFTLGDGGQQSETSALLRGLEDERAILSEAERAQTKNTDHSHIMEGLLQITGLHSALEHDRIVERPRREFLLVEREAQKRATEAIEALQRSRELGSLRPATSSIGLGPGVTTSAILASIRRRKLIDEVPDGGTMTKVPTDPLQRVVDQLLDLFSRHNGQCSSADIAKEFPHITGEDAVAFRQILRTISSLSDGFWRIKPIYRP
jgi:DNA excision repair protein ERCC-6